MGLVRTDRARASPYSPAGLVKLQIESFQLTFRATQFVWNHWQLKKEASHNWESHCYSSDWIFQKGFDQVLFHFV